MTRMPTRWKALALGVTLATTAGCDGVFSKVFTEPFEYGQVEVHTLRRSGESVEGVELVLFTGTRHLGRATSSTQGPVLFEFVPQGVMGVTAHPPPEILRPMDLQRGYVQTFRMREGEARELTFLYYRFGPGSIHIRVRDEDGAPMAQVKVVVYTPTGEVAREWSPPSGELRYDDLPFGPHGVRIEPGRGYTVPPAGLVADGLFVEDQWVEDVELTVPACRDGVIRALARVVEGGVTAPAPGVEFILYAPDGELERGTTEGPGTVTFASLDCGEYGVGLGQMEGYRIVDPAPGYQDGLHLVQNRQTLEATFLFAPCRGDIQVLVVDGTGNPVPGSRVTLYSPRGVLDHREVDTQGILTFPALPCNPGYAIQVYPPEGWWVGEGRGVRFFDGIDLDEPGQVARFTFVLTPAP